MPTKRLWILLATLALTALASPTRPAFAEETSNEFRDAPLIAIGQIIGGFTAPPSPLHAQPGTGSFIKLRYPAALAASGPDLYVADIGQGILLRVDTITQSFTGLRKLPAQPGVHLETDRDGSVYVVRPDSPEVERIARDGRRVAILHARFEVLRPADLAVAPDGKIWVSDMAGGVFAFHPSGRIAEPLVGPGTGFGDASGAATLLAHSADGMIGFDPLCRCAIVYDRRGIPIGRFAENGLLDPIDLAVDQFDRTWILDRGDRTIKIFENQQLMHTITAHQLGFSEISGIAMDISRAYISDGPGGKIGVFSITHPNR